MNEKISLKYIFKLLLKNKKALLWGQFFTIIGIFISVPIPLLLPLLVDEVLLEKPSFFVNNIDYFFGSGDPFYYIAIVTVVVILLRFLHFIFGVINSKIFTKISKTVIFDIRVKLLNHLKKVTTNEYETIGSGKIAANLITDVNTLDSFIVNVASKLITSSLTLIAVALIIINIDLVLGLMILFTQPTIAIISRKIAKKTGELKKEENKAIESFQSNINETLDLFSQIKASNKENDFFEESIKKADDIKITSNEFGYKSVAFEKLSYTIFLFAFEIFRATGLLLVAYSDLSIGLMFAMFGYIWFIMSPVQEILSIQYSLASAKAAIGRINSVLELSCEKDGDIKLDSKNGVDISLKNLSFSYNKDKNNLSNISFDIKAGEKIAIIGASGSGKTTISQLIAGFYEKSSGDILYNNISIDDIDKKSLRNSVFLVLQMPILFNNTLRFNLTMGEDIDDNNIYKALKIAQMDDVLKNMPNGLDTIVGKMGVRLSGGQRQRLSIARMILANPSVVIFDESTSALDVQTETNLFKELKEFLKDKTVITIAHRLSSVKNASKIYVLNDGELVQSGSASKLEQEDGHYLDFVKNQLI
ncbi:ABC transporter ATP-binding protein [Aliarcobacter skirrowii]|uniref:ABC transporter ATP-binding protein n=1 Tax=Aliarcobacter skirrowii CCUG 10374 TaxID=1032239 RepID=A0AAD0SMD9_9BACT|nr:ABC transporter ATP-binding protein [Aliarcobacter skirrowii]AXX84798.1 ABC transporter, ATP-binding/permease components [Aliarcobacter skirrowii CCUG 10374]KAB0620377.1 ABC transporter ATP-binding protein [Aliarcobacter skirrowii CCUG 10374]RXI25569.1 ABC transporter ATP-binding protein [Aliarcobacter skirrowii CCUG 10374]SUV14973.1 Putative multidrug export ATP-binding/permease protein SAV1866 [Aliarcobacter skirrowii]